MGTIILKLICSLAPVFLLLAYVIYRDRKHPEPARIILKGLFFGILSAVAVMLLHIVIYDPLLTAVQIENLYYAPVWGALFEAFINAALPEECVKLLFLWLLLRKCKEFDENMDGIVYAVCVGLGFAGFENILYVFKSGEEWAGTAILRALLAVPGHYLFAVLMGFFYSIVHFQPQRYGKYKPLILLFPILAHGIYDTICIWGEASMGLWIFTLIVAFWFSIKLHIFCLKRIKNIEQIDDDKHDMDMFMEAVKKETK